MKRIVLVLTCLVSSLSFAETVDRIQMKSGDVYRGQIIEQKFGEYVQVLLSDGNEKRLRAEDIASTTRENQRDPASIETVSNVVMNKRYEISAGTSGGVEFQGDKLGVAVTGSFHWKLLGPFQLGLGTLLQHTYEHDASATLMALWISPRINLVPGNYLFVNPALGFGVLALRPSYQEEVTESRMVYGGAIGVRVPITESVAYMPMVSVLDAADIEAIVTATIIGFSFQF